MNFIIRPDNDVMIRVIQYIEKLPKDQAYDVEIKKHNKRKTRQQEKYFHDLLDIICNFTGDDKTELKRRITWSCDIRDTFQTFEGKTVLMPKLTRDLKVNEYTELIQAAQMICLDLGLQYPDPQLQGFKL